MRVLGCAHYVDDGQEGFLGVAPRQFAYVLERCATAIGTGWTTGAFALTTTRVLAFGRAIYTWHFHLQCFAAVFIFDAYQSALWKTRIAKIGEATRRGPEVIHNLIKFIGRKGLFRNFSFQRLEDRAGNRCRFVPAQFGDHRGRDIFGPISRLPTIASKALAVFPQTTDFLLQSTVLLAALFDRT